jgi:hypothetical protein
MAAELFQNLDGREDECPTVRQLVERKRIDASKSIDPWGAPYAIRCDDAGVHAISAGADGREGTADDIRDDFTDADLRRVKGLLPSPR